MKVFGGFFLLLFVLSSVNAVIFIEDDFENRYNVGESVILEFKLSSDSSVNDFVESYLKCDGKKLLVDKRYVFLNSESKNFDIEFPLKSTGECQFEVVFRGDKAVSDEFEISSDIEIVYFLNDKYFFPNEKIVVYGNLTKFNGADFDGVIDFRVGSFVEKSYSAKNGSFSFEYDLPMDVESGTYDFILEVSEKDLNGDVLNYGKVEDSIEIKSKPTSILLISSESVSPGSSQVFRARVLDQAGNLMINESVVVKLVDSNSNIVFSKDVRSDFEFFYNFSSDFPRGTAYLNAYYGSISSFVPISILNNKKIDVFVVGNSIQFVNSGNVPYEGIVGYNLTDGNETFYESINISLGVGEEYFEELDYLGTFNITAGGSSFFSVPLTGAAVFLEDDGGFRWYGVFVILVFSVMLVLGYYLIRNKIVNGYFFSKKAEREYRKYGQKDFEDKPVDLEKEAAKKILVVANSGEDNKPSRVKAFMIFLKVNSEISEYESLFRNYGFRLNKVDSNLGYSLFYQVEGESYELKIFNFAKAIKRFADSRGDFVSIVLNRGFFEKKVSILKKFALFNREVLNMFPGKFVISAKIAESLSGVKFSKTETSVEVMGRKINLIIVN